MPSLEYDQIGSTRLTCTDLLKVTFRGAAGGLVEEAAQDDSPAGAGAEGAACCLCDANDACDDACLRQPNRCEDRGALTVSPRAVIVEWELPLSKLSIMIVLFSKRRGMVVV